MGATDHPFLDPFWVGEMQPSAFAAVISIPGSHGRGVNAEPRGSALTSVFIYTSESLRVPAMRVDAAGQRGRVPPLRMLRGGLGTHSPSQLPRGAMPSKTHLDAHVWGFSGLSCPWFGCYGMGSGVRMAAASAAHLGSGLGWGEEPRGCWREPREDTGARQGGERAGSVPAGCQFIKYVRKTDTGKLKNAENFMGRCFLVRGRQIPALPGVLPAALASDAALAAGCARHLPNQELSLGYRR